MEPPSIGASGGIGYGPRSDSSAYWKETGTRFCLPGTVVYGIPIEAPWYRPEPKSAWTGRSAPIEAMSRAEFFATGRRSTRSFQGLLRGKTGQRAAPRNGRPVVVAARPTRAVRKTSAASGLTRGEATPCPLGGIPSPPRMAPPADQEPPADVPCSACRGTGRVTSNLGGSAHEVVCPWCDGGGRRLPAHNA